MGSGVVAFLWNYLEELTPIYISAPVERARSLLVNASMTSDRSCAYAATTP